MFLSIFFSNSNFISYFWKLSFSIVVFKFNVNSFFTYSVFSMLSFLIITTEICSFEARNWLKMLVCIVWFFSAYILNILFSNSYYLVVAVYCTFINIISFAYCTRSSINSLMFYFLYIKIKHYLFLKLKKINLYLNYLVFLLFLV